MIKTYIAPHEIRKIEISSGRQTYYNYRFADIQPEKRIFFGLIILKKEVNAGWYDFTEWPSEQIRYSVSEILKNNELVFFNGAEFIHKTAVTITFKDGTNERVRFDSTVDAQDFVDKLILKYSLILEKINNGN